MNKQLNWLELSSLGYAGLIATIPFIQAFAQDATGTLSVSATVGATCSVTSSVSLPFGTYDPSSASPDDDNVSFNVTCSDGEAYYISLDEGLNPTGTPPDQRRMTDGGTGRLNYDLYQDTYTTKWGDGTVLGSVKQVTSAAGTAESHTIYGRIPIGQYVAAGSYSDTVNIEVYLGTFT